SHVSRRRRPDDRQGSPTPRGDHPALHALRRVLGGIPKRSTAILTAKPVPTLDREQLRHRLQPGEDRRRYGGSGSALPPTCAARLRREDRPAICRWECRNEGCDSQLNFAGTRLNQLLKTDCKTGGEKRHNPVISYTFFPPGNGAGEGNRTLVCSLGS